MNLAKPRGDFDLTSIKFRSATKLSKPASRYIGQVNLPKSPGGKRTGQILSIISGPAPGTLI